MSEFLLKLPLASDEHRYLVQLLDEETRKHSSPRPALVAALRGRLAGAYLWRTGKELEPAPDPPHKPPLEAMERKKQTLQDALATIPQSRYVYLGFWVSEKLQDADYHIEQAQACIAKAQEMYEKEASDEA